MLNFETFINEENSKNDPIPELSRFKNKLGIILLGTPGSGKSTFCKNFTHNIKIFSTDDVSLLHTQDPNEYHSGSSKLNINRILKFIQSGQNFIYETTGFKKQNTFDVFESAKKLGYKIIFIHMVVDLPVSKLQNRSRERNVDDEIIEKSYKEIFGNMGEFTKLDHDNYYIILPRNKKYIFYKYINGQLHKRKVDDYPIKKSNRI